MKELRGDLIAVGALYLLINMLCWLGVKQYHIHLLKQENSWVKTVVVDMDKELENFRGMLDSMNKYADELESENAEFHHSNKLLKDIR